MDNQPNTKPQKSSSSLRDFLSFFLIIAIAIIVAFSLITFVFRSYEVDGPSMESTLQNGNVLIVWKLARTWARITHHQYIPKRGDIVIFSDSNLAACGQDGTKQLVKRVIGLPGDRVVVNNNKYTVYDKQHPNGFDPDAVAAYDSDHHIPPTPGSVDITLSAHQLFVSGDNRGDSCDSRDFGPIATSDIIGQVAFRVRPISEIKNF